MTATVHPLFGLDRARTPYIAPGSHGQISTYNTGCRCQDCRNVSAADRRRTRAIARGEDPAIAERRHELRTLLDLRNVPTYQPARWTDQAACAGAPTDDWFPHRGSERTPEAVRARDLCTTCPVWEDCLLYALANRERHGIWGGIPTEKRKRLEHLDTDEAIAKATEIRDAWAPKRRTH